jgi:hypothetical protein
MPISYRIDSSRGLILTTASDTLTIDDLIAHKAALLADPQFRPGLKELSDVRGVRSLTLGPPEMRRLASLDSEHKARLGDYRLALVVPEDFLFGMARMYQQLTEENLPDIGVFRSVEKAVEWLGVLEAAR